jgi:hypothetical protein
LVGAISQFVGGISVGGSGGGGGASRRLRRSPQQPLGFIPGPAAVMPAALGQQPSRGWHTTYNIKTATVEDAFVARPAARERAGRREVVEVLMPVATITLESSNGDSVVISAPNDDFLDDDIILDTNPDSLYDTGFTVRTVSGAFEIGGRPVDENVPIREPILPFWLTPASRPRFQRLWGTPGNLQKVKCTWDGPSGPRWLIPEAGQADQPTPLRAASTPTSTSRITPWCPRTPTTRCMSRPRSPDLHQPGPIPVHRDSSRAGASTFSLTFRRQTPRRTSRTTANPVATVRATLEGLPSVGVGNVTVTGTPGSVAVGFRCSMGPTVSSPGPARPSPVGRPSAAANTGWFEVWNPTDQQMWLEWEFDPATSSGSSPTSFGQERKWGRAVGADAARMIVTPLLTQLLSVMV